METRTAYPTHHPIHAPPRIPTRDPPARVAPVSIVEALLKHAGLETSQLGISRTRPYTFDFDLRFRSDDMSVVGAWQERSRGQGSSGRT